MLTKEEIAEIRKRTEDRHARFRAMIAGDSHKNPDILLANLAETEGWDIVRSAFDSMILELLEPEEFEGSAEAYAVSGEARRLTIQALRAILQSVESAKASRISQKTTKGVSE